LALAGGGVYYWQHRLLTNKTNQLNDTSAAFLKQSEQYKATILPSASDFSPQCKSTTNSELIVASVTPQPVAGYQVYLEACANDSKTPVRVTAFKVNDDGSRSFAYGASTLEPICFVKTLFDASALDTLVSTTKIPICKTF
jgi:hypothetical protein